MIRRIALLLVPALLLAACDRDGAARDQIKVVGSSTVYPFTTKAAEMFVNANPGVKAPVVESTGSGAGLKLFCAGLGPDHPDIADASRRMKKGEYAACQANGVGEILEVQIGLDGVALAESRQGAHLQLSKKDIYLALAAAPFGTANRARTWRDVNAALPAIPIQVYGPPATSGTRDALTELILVPGCEEAIPEAKALATTNIEAFDKLCRRIRDDGPYVDSGENDNLIVQKLAGNPNGLGIFGYSYLEENADRLTGVAIEGVSPTYATIADGSYPGSRPLFLYVKKRHIRAVPGLAQFLQLYTTLWEPDGPLAKRGLIAAPGEVRTRAKRVVDEGIALDPAGLQ